MTNDEAIHRLRELVSKFGDYEDNQAFTSAYNALRHQSPQEAPSPFDMVPFFARVSKLIASHYDDHTVFSKEALEKILTAMWLLEPFAKLFTIKERDEKDS